jgi:hypothetical protein
MLIAALLVGLMVAYYFGLRPGMVAAGATAALFLLAAVIPAAATYAYAMVCAGVAGVVFLGPKLKRPDSLAAGAGGARGGALRVLGTARRAWKQVSGMAGGKPGSKSKAARR